MALPSQRVIPTLRITNDARSKTFYVERLGFTVEWEHRFGPSMPVFMSLALRDPDGNQLRFMEPARDGG